MKKELTEKQKEMRDKREDRMREKKLKEQRSKD